MKFARQAYGGRPVAARISSRFTRQQRTQSGQLPGAELAAQAPCNLAFNDAPSVKHMPGQFTRRLHHLRATVVLQRNQAVLRQALQGLPNDGARHLETRRQFFFTQAQAG